MAADQNGTINQGRLFLGSCFALIATSVAFAMVGAVMGPLKEIFILTNEQVGWIGGAALWGFPLTIVIFGPLVDVIGMRPLMRLAMLFHGLGAVIMIFANGFTMLFLGALTIAMGNGVVEAVCNPLVATVYPERKTEMLNKFHVWFPGGIVIGGLTAFLLDKAGIPSWQIKLAVILIPTVIYGILFTGQKFPETERVASGLSFSDMVKGTLMRPLFLILAFAMMITASLELGPNRWIPAVLTSAGMPGILVLVWISLLMAVLRYFAGPIVHKLSPTGILFASAIVGGIGLFWLSFANNFGMAILSSTVFAVGVCYFWPTLLGVVSERVPKGGSMALAWIGGIGMLTVGILTSPLMGKLSDKHSHTQLPVVETTVVLEQIVEELPAQKMIVAEDLQADLQATIDAAQGVLDAKTADGLPEIATANALRSVMNTAPDSKAAQKAGALLGPAENYGGKKSFRFLAPFAIIIAVIFGALYLKDRKAGGYQVEKI